MKTFAFAALFAAVVMAAPAPEVVAPPAPAGSTSVADGVTVVAETPGAAVPTGLAPVPLANPAASAAITCAGGQFLTYAIGTKPVPNVSLKDAQTYFSNWANDAPGTPISSNGNGSVGATRSWHFTDSSVGETDINETLYQVLPPTNGNSNLEQRWNISSTETYNGGLQIFTAYKDLTIGENSSGAVSLQYYLNVCANNQQQASQALPTIINSALTFWVQHVSPQ